MPNERNGIITMYSINVYSNTTFDSSTSNDSITLDNATMMYLFTDLEEFMEYTFEISAFTIVGEGPTSPSTSNTTDPAGIIVLMYVGGISSSYMPLLK